MSLNKETARAAAMREQVDKTLTNGVALISPTISVLLGGLNASARKGELNWSNLRNVKWGCGGASYGWRVLKSRSTANTGQGELKIRDFSQPDLHASPTIKYYMHDATWAVGEGDLALNRNNEAALIDLKTERMNDAGNSVKAAMASAIWAVNETGHNGGLSMFNNTLPAASTSYGSINMLNGTNPWWCPKAWDYGSSPDVATGLFTIVGNMVQKLTVSAEAGGGATRGPDFGVFDPDLWPYVHAYYESNLTMEFRSGNQPTNLNLMADGFRSVVIYGVTLFSDENYGGTAGYMEGGTTDEILFGHSDQMFLATSNTKSEGLITGHSTNTTDDMAWLAGQGGVFKTGMQAIGFKSPKFFGLAYT
jgi:hypothetical protein